MEETAAKVMQGVGPQRGKAIGGINKNGVYTLTGDLFHNGQICSIIDDDDVILCEWENAAWKLFLRSMFTQRGLGRRAAASRTDEVPTCSHRHSGFSIFKNARFSLSLRGWRKLTGLPRELFPNDDEPGIAKGNSEPQRKIKVTGGDKDIVKLLSPDPVP